MERSLDRWASEKHSRSWNGQLSGLTADLTKLVRLETRLAQAELSAKSAQITQSTSWMAIGGLLAFAGFVALVIAIALGYAEFLDFWLAALLVGLFFIVLGAMLVQVGRNQLNQLRDGAGKTARWSHWRRGRGSEGSHAAHTRSRSIATGEGQPGGGHGGEQR